jgi:hypothetical protein
MKKEFSFKPYASIFRLVIILSSVFILATIFLGILRLERLSTFCICKINYLAYSWISFAITILLSFIGLFAIYCISRKSDGLLLFDKINLSLIIAGFICGLVWLIVFAAFILNVL